MIAEYKVLTLTLPEVEEEINKWGRQGWQVLSFDNIGGLKMGEQFPVPAYKYLMFRVAKHDDQNDIEDSDFEPMGMCG